MSMVTGNYGSDWLVWVGLPGDMRPIPSPVQGTTVDSEVQQTSTVDLAGNRHVQRAPRALRSWDIEVPGIDVDDVAALRGLSQHAYGPPPYAFYDPFVARSNMLHPRPCTSARPSRGEPVVMPDGTLEHSSVEGTEVVIGQGCVPVLPGRDYTLSAFVAGAPECWIQAVVDGQVRGEEMVPPSQVPGGENACPNPALGVNEEGWFAYLGATGQRVAVSGAPRPWAFEFSGQDGQMQAAQGAVTPGEMWTFSVFLRGLQDAADGAISVGFNDIDGEFVDAVGYQNIPQLTDQWLRVEVSVTVPDRAATGYLIVYALADPLQATAARYQRGRLGAYADGDTLGWEWSGAAHNSPSAAAALGAGVLRGVVSVRTNPHDKHVWLRLVGTDDTDVLRVARPQIQEGFTATRWRPGEGMPRVVPGPLSQTYSYAGPDRQRRSVSLTLQEV